jgi:hypothetical protein
MLPRLLLATFFCLGLVYPILAQDKQDLRKPMIVGQTQPIDKLFAEISTFAKLYGGDEAKKELDKLKEEYLGEKGFAGIDTSKPILGYSSSVGEESFQAVLIIPITKEADFLDLLKRLKIDTVNIQTDKTLYNLQPQDDIGASVRLRFLKGYAYIGISSGMEHSMKPEELLSPAELQDPKEQGLIAVRTYLTRAPKDLFEKQQEQLENLKGMFDGFPLPESAQQSLENWINLIVRINKQITTDGEMSTLRVLTDSKLGQVIQQTDLTAKAGSQLQKDLQARKPTMQRFAKLISPETVAGGQFRFPLFADELRQVFRASLEAVERNDVGLPPNLKPLQEAVLKGLTRNVEAGDLDFAAVMLKRKGEQPYNALVAISFENPKELEAALRKAKGELPEAIQLLVKFDADKAGDIAIHTAGINGFLPKEAQDLFGEQAYLAFALAPKAIYVSYGPDAKAVVKEAIKAEPAQAPVVEVQFNPKKFGELMEKVDPMGAKEVKKVLGSDDKLGSLFFISVEGGERLRLSIGVNVKLIPRSEAIIQP